MRTASPAAATLQPRAHVVHVGCASHNATAPQANPNATRRLANHPETSRMRRNHRQPTIDRLKDFIRMNVEQTR